MHSSFSDWYRPIRPKLDADELRSRWQVVETLAGKLDLQQGLDLLRSMFDLPTRTPDFQKEFALSVHEVDPTFSQKNSQLELSVLAAGMLSELLKQKPTNLTDQIAMAIGTAICNGRLMKDLPHQSDVVEEAAHYQESRAVILRKPDQLAFSKTGADKIKEATTAFLTPVSLQQHQERFDAPFNLLNNALKAQSEKINRLQYEIRLQREESNILWWLLSEHSRDLNQPISKLDAGAAAVVIGKELADLITVRPGPRSAQGFLHHMLKKVATPKTAKKATDVIMLPDAVNATPTDWRGQWISSLNMEAVSDLCPIHLAAKKSLEVAQGKAWDSLFDAAAHIKATQEFSPLELATQVYYEAQLIAAIRP